MVTNQVDGQKQPEIIIAEGRLGAVEIPAAAATMIRPLDLSDPAMPIVFQIEGSRGYFIRVFDHRKSVQEAYKVYLNDKDMGKLDAVFAACPALIRFAIKGNTQYVAITDLGTPDMVDTGDEHPLQLTRGGHYDRDSFRVVTKDGKTALHLDTKVCVVEPRPPKPEKVEVEQPAESAETPINPMMQAALAGIKVG